MGALCSLFKCNGIEQRIIDYAKTGKGSFPQEITDFEYIRSEMGMRTGYYDIFKAKTIDAGHDIEIVVPLLTTQKLFGRELPRDVRDALISCFQAHNIESPEASMSSDNGF